MVYMLAAYSVIWILTFVFITSIFVRQRRLHRDLEVMQQLLEEQVPDENRSSQYGVSS
jgi:CcmD family protein